MLLEVFKHSLMITGFVFAMMVAVDYFNVITRGRLEHFIRGRPLRQYLGNSFLGSTPGCLGAFASASLYIHGFISFGAIVATMVATSGDAAFVMLALFPGYALFLFALLFIAGIIAGWIADKMAVELHLKPCQSCDQLEVHAGQDRALLSWSGLRHNLKLLTLQRAALVVLSLVLLYGVFSGQIGPVAWDWIRITLGLVLSFLLFVVVTVPDHFLEVHIWEHIVKKHLLRIFGWTLGALLVIHLGETYWNLNDIVSRNRAWVLLFAALVGLIPDSGPHLIFVVMFAQGMIPFSILLTSSIVQDGHGMLPILSVSIRDFVLIKVFNILFGLTVGYLCLLAGF
ncbi:MAG: putative manganese transporter [Candidatus Euphemobacter frigidus]|nr:putative manganese transporter [Candidatus Euphemobacter frigidus]MDP8275199.1 putative manganese transporter [Candidatus Euphemobacter frigidus]